MFKYSLSKTEDNIKLETDGGEFAPNEYSLYDMLKEANKNDAQFEFLSSKIKMMNDLLDDVIVSNVDGNIRVESDQELKENVALFNQNSSRLKSKLNDVLAGTPISVAENSFKENISVRLESADEDINIRRNIRTEGVGDFFSTIWNYIKKFFAWVWDCIKNLFDAFASLFRGTKSNLEKLKKDLEKMDFSNDERSVKTISNTLYYFTNVLSSTYRGSYLDNLKVALEECTSGLNDKVLEITRKINENVNSKTDSKKLASLVDYIIRDLSTKRLLNRLFIGCNSSGINTSKFKEVGNYYIIGIDNELVTFLRSDNNLQGEICKTNVVLKNNDFARLTSESARDDLIELCQLGIDVCDTYTKDEMKNLIDDFENKKSHFLDLIENIRNVTDSHDADERACLNEFNKLISSLSSVVTKGTNACLSAVSIIGKQPTFILKAIKEGRDTL